MRNSFKSVGEILKEYREKKGRNISREFQDYGLRLARFLGDEEHKALYIKLAKEAPRQILEKVLSFVKDSRARSKARLFMWKLKELRKEDSINMKGGEKNV